MGLVERHLTGEWGLLFRGSKELSVCVPRIDLRLVTGGCFETKNCILC